MGSDAAEFVNKVKDQVRSRQQRMSNVAESGQKSMSFQILCCASGGSFNIQNPTELGRKGLKGSRPTKATEITTVSMESGLNSSGTSSQDSQRCSSAVKSMIY